MGSLQAPARSSHEGNDADKSENMAGATGEAQMMSQEVRGRGRCVCSGG